MLFTYNIQDDNWYIGDSHWRYTEVQRKYGDDTNGD